MHDARTQQAQRATILIAEDQPDILENLSDYLTLQGYFCMRAQNGKLAFDMAVECKPDLIITDLGMPVWDGHTLMREVRNEPRLAMTPVIILTAWADRDNMMKTLAQGAVDYITKPFTLAKIDEALAKCLAHSSGTSWSLETDPHHGEVG